MLKEQVEKLSREHTDVGKYVVHTAQRMVDKEQDYTMKCSEAAVNQDHSAHYSGIYRAGVAWGLKLAREAMAEVLTETVDDVQHKGDKHHEKHFKDGIE